MSTLSGSYRRVILAGKLQEMTSEQLAFVAWRILSMVAILTGHCATTSRFRIHILLTIYATGPVVIRPSTTDHFSEVSSALALNWALKDLSEENDFQLRNLYILLFIFA